MRIDIETADLRPVHTVIAERLGRRVSPTTLWRWHQKGVRSRLGEVVRLECVRVGGVLCMYRFA